MEEKLTRGTKSSLVAGGQKKCSFQGHFHLSVLKKLTQFHSYLIEHVCRSRPLPGAGEIALLPLNAITLKSQQDTNHILVLWIHSKKRLRVSV